MRVRYVPVALAISLIAAPVAASEWDLIYTDRVDVTNCEGCAILLTGAGFGLIVNTGSDDLTAPDVFGAQFSVTSSRPDIHLSPFISSLSPQIMPILPGEAVGGVDPGLNGVLLDEVLAGETIRNTHPLTFIAFSILHAGNYQGPVAFDIVMRMGGREAAFTILADVRIGEGAIAFPSSARVTSQPIPTAARIDSWGAVKSRYRQLRTIAPVGP